MRQFSNGESLIIINLGIKSLPDTENFMTKLTELRQNNIVPDLLLYVTHPETISIGERDKLTLPIPNLLVGLDKLANEGISLVKTSRGGGITFHWPGQIVCYPIFKMPKEKRNIPAFVYKIEDVVKETLLSYGVVAERNTLSPAHHGLWVKNRKLLSIGLRITRWVTSFGWALNYEGSYFPAHYIRPCGIENLEFITLEEVMERLPPKKAILEELTKVFCRIFEKKVYQIIDYDGVAPTHNPSFKEAINYV